MKEPVSFENAQAAMVAISRLVDALVGMRVNYARKNINISAFEFSRPERITERHFAKAGADAVQADVEAAVKQEPQR